MCIGLWPTKWLSELLWGPHINEVKSANEMLQKGILANEMLEKRCYDQTTHKTCRKL